MYSIQTSHTGSNAKASVLQQLKGHLIVSCQPVPGGPFDRPDYVKAFAQAAEIGGAVAVRISGLENLATVRPEVTLLIVGLVKKQRPGSEIYITPTLTDVAAIASTGADIIAFDATDRPRPASLKEMIDAIHAHGCLAMADIATLEEGVRAFASGAELVATTLSGYTSSSPNVDEPDFELVRQLADKGVRVVAEGRITKSEEAIEARLAGAFAVTVGTAITRPEIITGWYVEALKQLVST